MHLFGRIPHHHTRLHVFLQEESGAITVDWTVLSAAAVSLALGTLGVMTDITGMLYGQVDSELRDRQLSDDWVEFYASHFQAMLEAGAMNEEQAAELHGLADTMANHELISHLAEGIEQLENGTLSVEQLAALVSVASVAHQRNVVDRAMLDYYFGFDGSDPHYMNTSSAPSSTS